MALLLLVVAGHALADEIYFKNGDRLTGQILRLESGSMTFKSKSLGEVKLPLAELDSFTADQPLDVRLSDRSATRATVSKSSGGQVTVVPNTAAARTIPLGQIKAINPKEGWTGSALAGL